MSANHLLDFFEELINSPDKAGDIKEITKKSKELFDDVTERLKSSSPAEREKVQNELTAAAEKMNEKFNKLCEQVGMTREQLETMVNDPSNFDSQTWSHIEGLKKDIQKNQTIFFQDLLGSTEEPTQKGKKKAGTKKAGKKKAKAFA